MNAITTTKPQVFNFAPTTFEQAIQFAGYLAESDLVPKDFKGKPGNCIIAMQWGAEIGMQPLQAIQNIACINGRPALWGDAMIALVRGSSVCDYIREEDDGSVATCRVKRKGDQVEHVRTFSMDDAKHAGLIGKQGPWSQYPKRMRQMRARAFALRDVFPDVLRGMAMAEEQMDAEATQTKHMGDADVVNPVDEKPPTTPSLPFYSDTKKFEELIAGAWQAAVNKGKSPEHVVSTLQSKYTLTDEQKERIMGLKAQGDNGLPL